MDLKVGLHVKVDLTLDWLSSVDFFPCFSWR